MKQKRKEEREALFSLLEATTAVRRGGVVGEIPTRWSAGGPPCRKFFFTFFEIFFWIRLPSSFSSQIRPYFFQNHNKNP